MRNNNLSNVRQYQNGFTLLELLVVVAISGILIGIGVPGLQNFVQSGRLTAQFNETVGLLNYARAESVKSQNFDVTLCASNDYFEPIPTCSGLNNWEDGWILFSNSNQDTILTPANNERLLRVGQPLTGGNTLQASGFDDVSAIRFDSRGFPDSSGTFTLCDARGANFAKAAIISFAGQTRSGRDEDGSITVNGHNGDDVICPI